MVWKGEFTKMKKLISALLFISILLLPIGVIFSEDIQLEEPDDFGRSKPLSCSCTLMLCGDSPCNTCECSDGKTYKSW